MRSTPIKTIVAAVAVAATFVAAPVSFARPLDQETRTATHSVPPPPSSIAISARKDYEKLRAAGAQDVGAAAAPQPAASAPVGFDWASAGIGAAIAAALSIAGLAIFSLRRPPARRAASA